MTNLLGLSLYSVVGMSFEFESNSCSTRTLAVRKFAEQRTIWGVRGKFECRGTPFKSLWEKSKVLILKAYMQVIVIKSVWGPGSCARGHGSVHKKVLKTDVFSGAVILLMLKVKQ